MNMNRPTEVPIDHWASHPFDRQWRDEVYDGVTRLGFWEWLVSLGENGCDGSAGFAESYEDLR